MSPTRYAKLQESHAFVGSRLRVPNVLHDELRNKLGGTEPDAKLRAWYLELNDTVTSSGEAILDVFQWIRPRFLEWGANQGDEAFTAEFMRLMGKS